MKHLKSLGLALMAAAALTAIVGAGTASATKLCTSAACTTDYAAGTEIKSSLNTSATLETTGGVLLDTCTGGDADGTTNTTEGTPLKVEISTLTWTGCTKTTDTTVKGSLTIERILNARNEPTGNGTVSGDGSSVTISVIFNTSCVYGTTTGTPLGTLVGGSPAVININALVARTVSNPLCPAETRWTASYTVSTPNPLYVG